MKRKIIDMHTHCFPPELAKRALTSPTFRWDFPGDGTIECERQIMQKFGIAHSVMLSLAKNPSTQEAVNAFALRANSKDIIAFGSVHPFAQNALETVEMLHDLGIKGIKFHNAHQQFDLSDDKCRTLYKKIGQLGMITVIHGGASRKRAEYWAWPSEVRKVIDCFGGAPFICAHMGGMNITEDEFRILKELPVFVDTAMALTWMSLKDFSESVRELGAKRVLFGTDLPWGKMGQEISFIEEAKLNEKEKKQIFYSNAAKLLKL